MYGLERGEGALTRLEKTRCADGRANTLGQEDLVVLGAQAGHHDAKHVEEAPDQEKQTWSVAVEVRANERPLDEERSARP